MGIEVAAYTALALTAYSTYEQGEANRKREQAASKQYQAEQRRAEVQNVRSVRQQIREQRLAAAGMTNVAAQAGGFGGSGLAGGIASTGSQLAGNLNYMGQIAAQNTQIGAAAMAGAQAQAQGAAWGSIGQFAGTIFQGAGGVSTILKPFSTRPSFGGGSGTFGEGQY